MKGNKILVTTLLSVMLVFFLGVYAQAMSASDLAAQIYAKGAKYGMTSADKVKIERYFSENPATDEEANAILAKADQAVAVMQEANVSNYNDLTTEQKNEVKSIAQSAANVVDATLVFHTSSVDIYKDGKLVETVTNNDGKLAYTGNNMSVVLGVSVLAIIALSTTVIAKRKIANAK